MSIHLSDETLIDLLEESAGGEARRHAAECPLCDARLGEAREGLRLAGSAEVPEPSPLYWEHFRRQVGRRLESVEPRRWPGWLWGSLAAAAAVVTVAVWLPRTPAGVVQPLAPSLPAWSALPPSEADEGLLVLAAIAPGAGDALGVVADCRDLGSCLADLSEEESRMLAEALRGQLPNGGTS